MRSETSQWWLACRERDPLPDEDVAEGHGRDGIARSAYNLTRVISIVGIKPLIAAIRL